MPSEGQALKAPAPQGNSSGQVFLSYSRKDREFVDRLARDLKTAGTDVWMDQSGIQAGRAWDDAVQGALDSASRVIVILSEHSVASPNVLDEVASALDSGKTVLPVLYRNCTMPLRLRRLQYIDFQQDYANGLEVLKSALDGASASGSLPLREFRPGTSSDRRDSRKPLIAGASIGAVVLLVVGLWLWIPSKQQNSGLPVANSPILSTGPAPDKSSNGSGSNSQTPLNQPMQANPAPTKLTGGTGSVANRPTVPQHVVDSHQTNPSLPVVNQGDSGGGSQVAKPDPAIAAELTKLQVELDQTKGEAQAVTEYWTNMSNQLKAQGLPLRSDIKAEMLSMNQSLASSSKFLDAGNVTGAQMSLKNANDQLEKLKAAENR